ncbi:hypothetical protein ACDQ55_11700 [Chitinophaga sp. 30R24]|uniref:hypothetical protein n=1 Tax=Chitinophaga sp. 30R24 TaxID=3248838 RepID=UPI003B90D55A
MFNNLAIDVALGLIFIYLLYSLLASVVQELLARAFNSRARLLAKGLRRMLADDHRIYTYGFRRFTFFNRIYEWGRSLVYFFNPFREAPFLKRFYHAPAIRRLGENSASSRPAYISPRVFSQTMVHLLRSSGRQYLDPSPIPSPITAMATEKPILETVATQTFISGSSITDRLMPDLPASETDNGCKEALYIKTALVHNSLQLAPDAGEHLLQLLEDAHDNIDSFRKNLEDWFNETMTRTSGWYRKQTQTWLLLIGIAIAAIFNVDSIAIARILMKDKNVRTQLVQLAASRAPSFTAITDTLILKNILHKDSAFYRADTSIRIFVNDTSLISVYAMLRNDAGDAANVLGISRGCATDSCQQPHNIYWGFTHPLQQNGWLVLGGWCITALAISLGAPFWFDLLGKVVKFRSAPPPSEETTGTP